MVDSLVLFAKHVIHHRLVILVPQHTVVLIHSASRLFPRLQMSIREICDFIHFKLVAEMSKQIDNRKTDTSVNGNTCGAFEQIFSRLTLLGGAKSLLVEKLPDLLIGRELEDSLIV